MLLNKNGLLIFIFIIVFLVMSPEVVFAEDGTLTEQWVDSQLRTIDTSNIRDYWEKVVQEHHGFLPESRNMDLIDFFQKDKQQLLEGWMLGLVRFLFHELMVNSKLLGTLILLAVFSIILQTVQNAFEQTTVSKVAYAIVYMVLIILTLNTFKIAIDYTIDAVQTMSHFLMALLPLVLALVATAGGITSVTFFRPLIIFLINTSGWLISVFVLPLLFLSALLQIVSTMTDHYKVTKLGSLLRNVAVGTLAVFFAVFLGVLSVQGSATAISDGIVIKTAKFVTGNIVPVVGRMFTDATDTVISASMLVKNTVGIFGLVILVCIAAFPAIKVLALALIYNIASAVLQPLGGGPIIESLSIMGKSMIFIFAALAIVSIMFFLAVTIIIASGNLSLLVR